MRVGSAITLHATTRQARPLYAHKSTGVTGYACECAVLHDDNRTHAASKVR